MNGEQILEEFQKRVHNYKVKKPLDTWQLNELGTAISTTESLKRTKLALIRTWLTAFALFMASASFIKIVFF